MSNPQTSKRATEVLQRYGLTVREVLDSPDEVLDVPPPYPAGRKYHFAANREVALIVNEDGVLVSSLPGHKALESIKKYKASQVNGGIFKHGVGWTLEDKSQSEDWAVQHLVSPSGVWTVHQVNDSRAVAILFGMTTVTPNITNLYALDDDDRPREFKALPGAVIELAWFIQGCAEEASK